MRTLIHEPRPHSTSSLGYLLHSGVNWGVILGNNLQKYICIVVSNIELYVGITGRYNRQVSRCVMGGI